MQCVYIQGDSRFVLYVFKTFVILVFNLFSFVVVIFD